MYQGKVIIHIFLLCNCVHLMNLHISLSVTGSRCSGYPLSSVSFRNQYTRCVNLIVHWCPQPLKRTLFLSLQFCIFVAALFLNSKNPAHGPPPKKTVASLWALFEWHKDNDQRNMVCLGHTKCAGISKYSLCFGLYMCAVHFVTWLTGCVD